MSSTDAQPKLSTSAKGREARGCTNLGALYAQGRGVTQDDGRAAKIFEQSCATGEAGACFNLGLFYEKGRSVTADPKRAAELFQKACEGGMDQACGR